MNDLDIFGFIRDVGVTAINQGFYDGVRDPRVQLLQLYGEVAEVVDAIRAGRGLTDMVEEDGKPEGVPAELADVVLTCFSFAYYYGIDLEAALTAKHAYNKTRPRLHGRKF